MPRTFTLASRASQLAQIQTNIVLATLQEAFPPSATDSYAFTTSFMSTAGDKNQSQALYLLGGKALWTKELEVALKEHHVDMLIHSLKDVPTVLPDGCLLGAILEERIQSTWKTLDDLPSGSVVGTSSVRRVAQLKRKYSNLKFLDVVNRITSDIAPPTLYHAVSQGALAVEVRSDDVEAIELCKKLTHRETSWKCRAERACLRVLEGGCSVPVGVASGLAAGQSGEVLTLTGCVTGIDGKDHVEHTLEEVVTSVEDAEKVGEKLAKILMESGAKKILTTSMKTEIDG
ncbi:hypothetical protein BDZ97DRAFT_1777070, partial [Flammula alnicola]